METKTEIKNGDRKLLIDFETGIISHSLKDEKLEDIILDDVERFCLYCLMKNYESSFKTEIKNLMKENKVFFPTTRIEIKDEEVKNE